VFLEPVEQGGEDQFLVVLGVESVDGDFDDELLGTLACSRRPALGGCV
jgi:hypothetical protein